jgi:hypothetical protein
MEMVSGGWFSQYCQSDAGYFMIGSVVGGVIAGGPVGYFVGLAVGGIGADLIRNYGSDC